MVSLAGYLDFYKKNRIFAAKLLQKQVLFDANLLHKTSK